MADFDRTTPRRHTVSWMVSDEVPLYRLMAGDGALSLPMAYCTFDHVPEVGDMIILEQQLAVRRLTVMTKHEENSTLRDITKHTVLFVKEV